MAASLATSPTSIAVAKTYKNRQDWEHRAFQVQLQLFEPCVHPETLLSSVWGIEHYFIWTQN